MDQFTLKQIMSENPDTKLRDLVAQLLYDDIINLPHPVSQRHSQMSMHDRAAQFSPFAALTGHGAAIEETERETAPFFFCPFSTELLCFREKIRHKG